MRSIKEISKMIMGSQGARDICTLIDARVAEFRIRQLDSCNVATAFRKLLQSQRDGAPRSTIHYWRMRRWGGSPGRG